MPTVATRLPAAAEQRVILQDISWQTYDRLLADQVDRRTPRFTYDRGVLEIVSPGSDHEEGADTLKLLVEVVAASLGIPVKPVGSMTYRRQDQERGFEPDGSFYVQNEARVRDRRIDPAVDPPPDLVIEIDVSRSSLDKLPIFARLGVPEVWRYDGQRVAILTLVGDTYQASDASLAIPVLTSDVLARFLAERRTRLRPDWLHAVIDWARARRPSGGGAE